MVSINSLLWVGGLFYKSITKHFPYSPNHPKVTGLAIELLWNFKKNVRNQILGTFVNAEEELLVKIWIISLEDCSTFTIAGFDVGSVK